MRDEFIDHWREILKEPYNFFKHGAADPDQELAFFDPAGNEVLLFEVAQDFLIAFGEIPMEAKVFVGWYLSAKPGVLTPAGEAMFSRIVSDFAGLTDRQKFRRALELVVAARALPS